MFKNFLLVGAGGAIGSMLRYAFTVLLPRSERGFPWATVSINLIGCLLIGLLTGLALRYHWLTNAGWALLAIGLCGGFTTFSAFALDTVKLFQEGAQFTAVLYTVISTVAGIILCYLGYSIIKP